MAVLTSYASQTSKSRVPKDAEVLVQVYAVAVTRADCATREANRRSGRGFELASRAVFGLRRLRQPILGSDFSGMVVAVGRAVKEFAAGDEVFGSTGIRFGAYAEFISRPASSRITRKPRSLSFVEAAGITDGGLYALGPLRAAKVQNGDAVLVYGASGAIGTAGVQLAKYFGAHVTAVTSTKNLELVKSLGPDHVIDYTKVDFTKNGQSYDVIFDAVGKHSFVRSRGSLRPGGRFLPTDGFDNFLRVFTTRFQDKKVIFPGAVTKKDVVFLRELIEAGRFRVVIDRTYGLEDMVEAHRYVDTGKKVGNVILTVAS